MQTFASLELGPGVRAVKIKAPYSIKRSTPHGRTETIGTDPLTVRGGGGSKFIVSFRADDRRFAVPKGAKALAWLTHIDATLTSGQVVTAWHRSLDYKGTFSEEVLTPGAHGLDLLLDDPCHGAHIAFGRPKPTNVELRVRGFECQCLLDEESDERAERFDVPLDFSGGWHVFYGDGRRTGITSRLRYLRFQRMTKPRLLPWLERLDVLVVPEEQMSQVVYVSGLYEPCTASALRQILAPGDTFVDVGANIGLLTMLASRWVGPAGSVLSFEPSRREFARLENHLDRNALGNVHPVHAALGSREERRLLHVAHASRSGLNTFKPNFGYEDVTEAYTETTPVLRLDDVVRARAISRVDAIKIDVEGDEVDVVMGAKNTIARDRPAIIIEMSSERAVPDDATRIGLESLLRSLDYEFVAIDGDAGALRRVPDLCLPAENFLAAPSARMSALPLVA
jgi:FkbM family methyltransferase